MNLLRRLIHLIFYHAYVRRKISRTDTVSECGFVLRVPKTVFHPSFYLTSRFFGAYLAGQDFSGKRGLDVGCGSGLLSLVGASRGARMVALDINPQAVKATVENARANRLDKKIVPVQSDLFAHLSPMHRNFDFILCNPPFYKGKATDVADHAWRGGEEYEFIRRLAAESGAYLRPEGIILLVLSTNADVDRIVGYFRREGYNISTVAQKRYLFESLLVVQAFRA